MAKKILFVVAILIAAGVGAYFLGLFNPKVNQTIDTAIEQTKQVVDTVKEKTQ